MIVMKFGGTSVRDAEWISRVLDVAEGSLDRAPVLVASAMGKSTDALVGISELATSGDTDGATGEIDKLEAHHTETVEQLVPAEHQHARREATERVTTLFRQLRSLVQGLLLVRECTPRTMDALLAFGELLSTAVIAYAAQARGLTVELLDSRQLIVTDAVFTAATPDFDQTNERIGSMVHPEPGKLYVAQGFIAATPDRVTTTLGRGGSDYTATIFGAALNAEEVQIWTDVDGIMTTDPRIVEGAMTIPELSYGEAAELAYFGARVVHPFTIQPAIELDIPVVVRNTARPDGPGTRIIARSPRRGVQALAEKRGITVITIHSYRMLNAYGFLSRIFSVFDRFRLPVDLVATSEVSVSMTIDRALDLTPVIQELEAYGPVEVERHKGIVCLVGQDLWKDSAVIARVFNTVTQVPVRMISLGSSDTNLSIVVSEENTEEAVRLLHEEFFSRKG